MNRKFENMETYSEEEWKQMKKRVREFEKPEEDYYQYQDRKRKKK